MYFNRILNINGSKCLYNINAVYVPLNKNSFSSLIVDLRSLTTSTQLQTVKNELSIGPDSSVVDSSSSSVIKSFQLLRTKPRGYDDVNHMLELSNKTLGNLPLLKSHELADICEILSKHKYRNILLMHGISESFYWMCKLRKVKLRELSRFLKSCFILRYIPNVRYLDVFFKEIDDERHVKSVGDYLRYLQFLVHSELWISEKYIKLYLRLDEYCTKNMGLMSHTHLSSFAQTHLLVDDSDSDVFEKICLNFERDLSSSEVSRLRMLNNSLLCSKIENMPTSYARVLRYYLSNRKDSLTPESIDEVLRLLAKFYYRDTECLNKIGLIISNKISNYSFSQLESCLNQLSALSYKHKQLVMSVSRLIGGVLRNSKPIPLESSTGDLFSKFGLIASLSNLISKVKYNHIGSINSISTNSMDALAEIKGVLGSDDVIDSKDSDSCIDSKNNENCVDVNRDLISYSKHGSSLSRVLFKQRSQKWLAPDNTSIITTNSYLEFSNESEGNKSERPRRSILRKLKRGGAIVTKEEEKEYELKYVPESTDIISVQSLSEYFKEFYLTYFNGVHPASRRLNNRRLMKQQMEKDKKGPEFESSKSLSKVYYERNHDTKVNSSIRRIKYKMKYSGSRVVQPSTFYINQVKILKRCFLSPFIKISTGIDSGLVGDKNGLNKLMSIDSLVGKNSLLYVDNKLVLRPYLKKQRFKHKTMKEFKKIMSLSNRVDSIIKYFTDNNLWNSTSVRYNMGSSQLCLVDYVANVIGSLSRQNYVSYHLFKCVLEGLVPRSVEIFLKEYEEGDSNGDLATFLQSIHKIIDAMKITVLNDKSGTILSMCNEILCSEQLVSLTNHYLMDSKPEYRPCYKMLDNLCRMSFYTYVRNPSLLNGNESNAKSTLSNESNGNSSKQNILMTLSTISKVIYAMDRNGYVDKIQLEDKNVVNIMNNMIYGSWLLELVKRTNNGVESSGKYGLECRISDEYCKDITEITHKCICRLIEQLDGSRCDTHLIQKYMNVINRYKELLKFIKKDIGDELKGDLDENLKIEVDKSVEWIEDSYIKLMENYNLNCNVILDENKLFNEIKNKLIPKYGIKNINNGIQFYKNGSIQPPLLYYYYYNYYCNI